MNNTPEDLLREIANLKAGLQQIVVLYEKYHESNHILYQIARDTLNGIVFRKE